MRFLVISVLVSSLLSGCQDPLKQQRHDLAVAQAAEAMGALDRGELQRALYAAELAAQYDPLDPAMRDLALRVSLAQIAAARPSMTLEQFGRAAYEAETLSGRDPASRHIYDTVRAIEAFARGDSTGAEKRLREVTESKPTYSPAWLMLGDVLQATRRPKDALAAYETVYKLEPKNPRAVTNLGMLYAQTGDKAKAIEFLMLAMGIEETGPLRATLGNVYLALDRPIDALPHFAHAASLEPRDGRHRVSLGETHLRLDQVDEAAAAFRDAAALGTEPWASRGLGAVALKRKDFAAANVAFARVLALSPDEVSTLFLAAEAQEGLGHPQEAAKLYSRFAELADKVPTEAARVVVARDRLSRLATAPRK